MDRVPGFQELLQGLSPAMTSPSFASLRTLVSGWLFSGRTIVTRMIVAAGSGATKHFSSYHRLVSTASWSLDAMGLAMFAMIGPFLGDVVGAHAPGAGGGGKRSQDAGSVAGIE